MALKISENNVQLCKILAVTEFTKSKVSVSFDKPSGGHYINFNPTFTLDDGTRLFSSNSICRYLWLQAGKPVTEEDEKWLTYESGVVRPFVAGVLLGKNGKFRPTLQPGPAPATLGHLVICSTLSYLKTKKDFNCDDFFPPTYADFERQFKNILPKVCATDCLAGMYIDDRALERGALGDVEKIFSANSDDHNSGDQRYTPGSETFNKLIELWNTKTGGVPVHDVQKPILPSADRRNVLITAALPYVNNVPHLGNIVGSVLSADVFSRFCRMRDYNVLYVGGTDEYGTATETKALELKCSPRELCDKFNAVHNEVYKWFDIGFDIFGRTSTDKQTEIVQHLFKELHSRGNFCEESVDQLYCGQCPRFLADRFVEGTCPFCAYEDARGDQCDKCSKLINAIELGNPRCKMCKSSPTVKSSKHLFLDMPKLDAEFREWQKDSSTNGKWTQSAKVITNAWLRDGLKPRCITRDLKWGVPVPLEGYESKVFYVWFDACAGYVSITATYTDQWEKWWRNPENVELFQFMGKDNVPFHAIVFPMCQIGTGEKFTKVNHVIATEYLNYEDTKFSKSRGVGVFGTHAEETGICSDVWRFYMMYMRPETQDTSFSWVDLQTKNNSELLNNLGNFIYRCLSFACTHFGNRVPDCESKLDDTDKTVLAQVARYYHEFLGNLEDLHIRDALRALLMISKTGNQYIQASKPWEKVKSPATVARSKTIVFIGVQICALIAGCLEPFMPQSAAELRRQLGIEKLVLEDEFRPLVPPNNPLNAPRPLFKKIENEQVAEFQKKFSGQPEEEPIVVTGTLEQIRERLSAQGTKVRNLKAAKCDKATIDQEVAILKRLKAELVLADKMPPTPRPPTPPTPASPVRVCPIKETPEELLTMMAKQQEVVKELKRTQKDSPAYKREIEKLLILQEHYQLVLAYQPQEPFQPRTEPIDVWNIQPREFTAEELDDSRSNNGEYLPDRIPGGAWKLHSPAEWAPLKQKSQSLPSSRSPSEQAQGSSSNRARGRLEKSSSLQEKAVPEAKAEGTDKAQGGQENQVPPNPQPTSAPAPSAPAAATSAPAAATSAPAAAKSAPAAAKPAGAKSAGKSKKKRK